MENQTPENVKAPEFSVNDLKNLRSIVDAAVRRGAFAASEMSAIGAVYDRVNTFLNAVAPETTATATDENLPQS